MRRADVKLGFSCNNNCVHCVVGDKRGKFPDKPIESIRTEFEEAVKRDCEEVVLTGGEPTLRKDILHVIRTAKEAGFQQLQMQTNGRMLSYKSFCKEVIDAGVNDFVVALHGYIPEQHDYLTGTQGSFVQTVNAIKNLKSLNQTVAINCVVTKPNFRNLPEIAKLLVKLNVDQIQFAFVHPLGTALKNFYAVVPRMSLVEPYVKKGLNTGASSGVCVMTEAIPYCFMRGFEGYVAETIIPPTMIYDINTYIADFAEKRVSDGKLKSPSCAACKYYAMCEGPWREYPEHYGWDEFKPLS